MSGHSILAPSSAHRWSTCIASLAMEAGRPDKSSVYSDEGTAAHDLSARCFDNNVDAISFLGTVIPVVGDDGVTRRFKVDKGMACHVQKYLDRVHEIEAVYAQLGAVSSFTERKVSHANVVGFVDQSGTADKIIVSYAAKEVCVNDLKYGMGVRVDAEQNEQMMIYGAAVVEEIELIAEIERVRFVIHQPRLDAVSEWSCPIAELREFCRHIRAQAELAMEWRATKLRKPSIVLPLNLFCPTKKNCQFCKASGDCIGQDKLVTETVEDDFENLDEVGLV